MTTTASSKEVLAVLYSTGGLGDVGRHAVRAALDYMPQLSSIKVVTQHPETLNEANWNCGCPEPHEFSKQDLDRIQVVTVETWSADEISKCFDNVTAVVSCLGNRQPFHGDRVGAEGTKALVQVLREKNISRVVSMSSVGIEEDWPPVEWFWGGTVMKYLFLTICRKEFKDLTGVEQALRGEESLDYLIVRPVGVGEDVVPVNKWFIQKEKHKDKLFFNMAKLDVARFMVQEALVPTLHKKALVIGGDPAMVN